MLSTRIQSRAMMPARTTATPTLSTENAVMAAPKDHGNVSATVDLLPGSSMRFPATTFATSATVAPARPTAAIPIPALRYFDFARTSASTAGRR
jgi:hypothetical protein